jgi:hypothetical protein
MTLYESAAETRIILCLFLSHSYTTFLLLLRVILLLIFSPSITFGDIVVTICTTFFNINQNSAFFHRVYLHVLYYSHNKQELLNNINLLVFLIETQCVHCEEGTAFLEANLLGYDDI